MAGPKDYYKILQIDPHADEKTIKRAYRKLARQYHPDAGGKGNEERFKEINEAYQVLSNPQKRVEYDRLRIGYANRASQSWGPGFRRVRTEQTRSKDDTDDWASLFEDLFGAGGWTSTTGTATTGSAQVPEHQVSIGLEDVARGSQVTLTVESLEPCPNCRGTSRECPRCGGMGSIATPKTFTVKIPPGVPDGATLRVGEHARLRVTVRDHPRFVRQGNDLRGRLRVAVPLAAIGGEIAFKPLVGEQVSVKIPSHTNAGKVLRLRGLGLPARGKNVRGDLLLEVELMFPEPFRPEDDRLYQQLLKGHHDTGGEIYAPR